MDGVGDGVRKVKVRIRAASVSVSEEDEGVVEAEGTSTTLWLHRVVVAAGLPSTWSRTEGGTSRPVLDVEGRDKRIKVIC